MQRADHLLPWASLASECRLCVRSARERLSFARLAKAAYATPNRQGRLLSD